ncbi:MAG: hypothetical protein AB4290_03445, partial [Spirulina sp.]
NKLLQNYLDAPDCPRDRQRDLVFALGDFDRLGADLAIQDGELLRSLALAERAQNKILSFLLDLPILQESGFKWSDLQQYLNSRTAAIVWHLGLNGLATFILKPNTA